MSPQTKRIHVIDATADALLVYVTLEGDHCQRQWMGLNVVRNLLNRGWQLTFAVDHATLPLTCV